MTVIMKGFCIGHERKHNWKMLKFLLVTKLHWIIGIMQMYNNILYWIAVLIVLPLYHFRIKCNDEVVVTIFGATTKVDPIKLTSIPGF